jgi:microcystin-dependent protein
MALAGAGSGLTNRVLGSITGTETVTPSIATMASHGHVWNPSPPLAAGGANNNQNFAGTNSLQGTDITNTGGSAPANTMQPTTFMNVMVKL